jgi:hypothetical protein
MDFRAALEQDQRQARLDSGAAGILLVFRTSEILGDQSSIPGGDGVGFGNAGDLTE